MQPSNGAYSFFLQLQHPLRRDAPHSNPYHRKNQMSADHPAHHAIAVRFRSTPLPVAGATNTLPPQFKSLDVKRRREGHLTPLNPADMRMAIKAKRTTWATLDLRQDWADAAWLRAYLTAAGLSSPVSVEPATVPRMKAKLRSINIHSPEVQDAIGMSLAGYLKANPRLPLWVALALVLEATGRFTPVLSSEGWL